MRKFLSVSFLVTLFYCCFNMAFVNAEGFTTFFDNSGSPTNQGFTTSYPKSTINIVPKNSGSSDTPDGDINLWPQGYVQNYIERASNKSGDDSYTVPVKRKEPKVFTNKDGGCYGIIRYDRNGNAICN